MANLDNSQFATALFAPVNRATRNHVAEAIGELAILRAENARLRAMIEQMGDRLLLMSQVLTRRAERPSAD